MTTETAARQNVTSRMAISLALALILALGASGPVSSQSQEGAPGDHSKKSRNREPVITKAKLFVKCDSRHR